MENKQTKKTSQLTEGSNTEEEDLQFDIDDYKDEFPNHDHAEVQEEDEVLTINTCLDQVFHKVQHLVLETDPPEQSENQPSFLLL
jgi:hypothetical protein